MFEGCGLFYLEVEVEERAAAWERGVVERGMGVRERYIAFPVLMGMPRSAAAFDGPPQLPKEEG